MEITDSVVTKTYSMTLGHVAKVRALAKVMKMGQSEVLRLAVDELYEAVKAGGTIETTLDGPDEALPVPLVIMPAPGQGA